MSAKRTSAPVAKMPAKRTKMSPAENDSSSDEAARITKMSSIVIQTCKAANYPLTYEELFYSPYDACGIAMRCSPRHADDSLDSSLWRSYFMEELRPRLLKTTDRSRIAMANLMSRLILDVTAHMVNIQEEFNLYHMIMAEQNNHDGDDDHHFIMKSFSLAKMT